MKLRWSERSVNDLIAIQKYIARDNPRTAKKWVAKLRQCAKNAADAPLAGLSSPNLIKMTYAKYFWAIIVSSIAFVMTTY